MGNFLLNFSTSALVNLFYKTSYLGVIGLFLLDFYFYFGFVKNNLVSPIILAGLVIVVHLIVSKKTKQKLPENFVRFNWYTLAPASLLLALVAYYLEEYGLLFPNYFFVNFDFHYLALPFLALPAFGFGAVHTSKTFWQNNWKNLVLLISIIIVIGAGFLFYFDNELYRSLTTEDSLVEYLTALGFVASGVIALFLIKKRSLFSQPIERKVFVTGCIIASLGFLIIAGEEISWGQRIINFDTPAAIVEQNRQGEINLHNSELIWPYVYTGYWLIGLYGMSLWILDWMSKSITTLTKKQQLWKKLLIPGGHLFVLFGMISLYVWLRSLHGPWKYQPWEEFSELLLVMGFVIHLSEAYFTFPKTK